MPDAPTTPLVSVIIPVFNDLERLRLCLEAIAAQTWPATQLEIIVADNASNLPVAPALEDWLNILTVLESQPGSYVARNTAVKHAKGDVYAFTDSDCIPEPDWIEQGLAGLAENGGRGFVGGRVHVFPRNPANPNFVERYEMICAFDQARYLRNGFSGAGNLFVSADVFQDVGPFDPKLRSNGDRDWGERASAQGHLGVYCEGAVVSHPARSRLRDLQRRTARVVGGRYARGKQRRLTKVLIFSFLPRVSRMVRVFKSGSEFSLRHRASAAIVRMLVEYFRAWEGVRVRLGGEPYR